jgi:FkbM family methyltransferase
MKDTLARISPRLFDWSEKFDRSIGSYKVHYPALRDFNEEMKGSVRFIQLGASDGLRNDPIREFVVWNEWSGVFVEPIPPVFDMLKGNYGYLDRDELSFANCLVTDQDHVSHTIYAYSEEFLSEYDLEERMEFLRKSSIHKEHLNQFIPVEKRSDEVIEEFQIPSFTLKSLIEGFFPYEEVDLLVIDVEGAELPILRQLQTLISLPRAVFYESEHLNEDFDVAIELLSGMGYSTEHVGGNSLARL